jgi:ribonuclease HII
MLLNQGVQTIAGVDEAGRGPLAGPVVAAAVMFPIEWIVDGIPEVLKGLNDSKKLTVKQRETFFDRLIEDRRILRGISCMDARIIDEINILQATHRAMNEALSQLDPKPVHALVDGTHVKSLKWPQTALVKGDSLSYSIAAASVLAKVTRDRIMLDAHVHWPQYGFEQHKGYPTQEHMAALAQHGPCPIHRLSFAPLKPREPELFPI